MKKFVSTMVAGFVGAALLLGVAYATGVVGGSTTTQTVVKGEPASFKTTGLTPQQVYEQNVGSVVEIVSTFPGATTCGASPPVSSRASAPASSSPRTATSSPTPTSSARAA